MIPILLSFVKDESEEERDIEYDKTEEEEEILNVT